MALFSKKKEPKSSGPLVITEQDEILAYLDEVFRRRVSLVFAYNKKEHETDILLVEAKNNVFRIQQRSAEKIPHGADLVVGFSLDKTWWTFPSKLLINKEKPYLIIPKVIKHTERRKNQRTSFSAREQVKVTVMEGLGSGYGVFGMARDVSVDGMSLSVEKAMNLANEKEVTPSTSILRKGTRLSLVKVNKIPGCPLMEISGIAQRMQRDGKWYLSMKFFKLSKAHQAMIERFVEPRLLAFKPTRRSQKRRMEMEAAQNDPATKREGPSITTSVPTATGASADKPGAAPGKPAPPPVKESGPIVKMKILVVGDGLMEALSFLGLETSPFEILPGLTPVGIIKCLSEHKPPLMLCGMTFKERQITEILEKIENMGALGKTKVVICAENMLGKDRVKFKMMNLNDVIDLPITNREAFNTQLGEMAKA